MTYLAFDVFVPRARVALSMAAIVAGSFGLVGCGSTLAASPSAAARADTDSGPVFYFSDCQSGASPQCVPGDNSNKGTSPSTSKQTVGGMNLSALPAGTRLLFARGGAWTGFTAVIRNLNATPNRPIVFDSYEPSWGGAAPPWLRVTSSFVGFQFGIHGDVENDGGYTVRNLKLDGAGVGDWGLWLRSGVRNVTIDNVEITGFKIAVHSQQSGPYGNTFVTLRKSNIHHNSQMGVLGEASDLVIEGNNFANNNFSGSALHHAIYLGGHGKNGVIRGNALTNNSVVNGVCTGGNITVHGRWDSLLIEGNTMTQAASSTSCYGFSLSPGYDSAEYIRNVVVRANILVNLGGCSICAAAAPGILVEDNQILNTQPTYHAAITVGGPIGVGDALDTDAVVRNNTIYLANPASGSEGIRVGHGSNLQVVSNLIYFGASANPTHYCFRHSAVPNYAAFRNNLCHHAGGSGTWSATHKTLASAQAAGFDIDGKSDDPKLVTTSATNGWRCQIAHNSPALNAGHATLSSERARSLSRAPDVGACERGTR